MVDYAKVSDLAEKTTVVGTDEIEIQETGGGTSKKATANNLVIDVITEDPSSLMTSQAEAEAGTSVLKFMNPRRVFDAITAWLAAATNVDLGGDLRLEHGQNIRIKDSGDANRIMLGVDTNNDGLVGNTNLDALRIRAGGVEGVLVEDGNFHIESLYRLGLSHDNQTYFQEDASDNLRTVVNGTLAVNIDSAQNVRVANGDLDVSLGGVSMSGSLNIGDTVELTISSGIVTKTGSNHYIDTEADAATDDLDTINGGNWGDIIFLSTITSSRVVTIKDGTGNIYLTGSADFVLDSPQDCIMLIYRGTNWWGISLGDIG